MANIRDIKKDINYLTGEVVSDCFLFLHLHTGKKDDEIMSILNDVIALRNDLITRVNNVPAVGDKKQNKAHFNTISSELLIKVDEHLQKLSKIAAS